MKIIPSSIFGVAAIVNAAVINKQPRHAQADSYSVATEAAATYDVHTSVTSNLAYTLETIIATPTTIVPIVFPAPTSTPETPTLTPDATADLSVQVVDKSDLDGSTALEDVPACVRGKMKCVDGIVRPCMKRYGSCFDECDGPDPALPTPTCAAT